MDTAPLLPGDPARLGRFRLLGRLGHGGQGTVYLGCDERGDRLAIKRLKMPGDARARRAFEREVVAARRVAPFCTARIVAADTDAEEPYVASEFIKGPSLRARVEKAGPFTGGELWRLAVGIATALVAIHQAGVIHRDLKPDNVIMGPDGPASSILGSRGTRTLALP